MVRVAFNYVYDSTSGTINHGADSHFANYFPRPGKDFDIDVAINNYGDNPLGIQDKMTSIDLLRMPQNLRAKVSIPVHHDIWTNYKASTDAILRLWKMRKESLQCDFHPFIWEVGGKYTYPRDKDRIEYHHPRCFDDDFGPDSHIQFRALLSETLPLVGPIQPIKEIEVTCRVYGDKLVLKTKRLISADRTICG